MSSFWKNRDAHGNPCVLNDCPAIYCDRWRHRLPKYSEQTGMRPHIDSGGLSRWADTEYFKAYSPLFQDKYEEFDPWIVGPRTHTSSVVFRSFQGWVATTSQCPGSGGLTVLPVLKESIACIMMRPFLKDVEPQILCGCDSSHPDQIEVCKLYHSFMNQSLISIGHINAGDMVRCVLPTHHTSTPHTHAFRAQVMWHPDIIHGVEDEDSAQQHPSNVVYTATLPMCPLNARYNPHFPFVQLQTFPQASPFSRTHSSSRSPPCSASLRPSSSPLQLHCSPARRVP